MNIPRAKGKINIGDCKIVLTELNIAKNIRVIQKFFNSNIALMELVICIVQWFVFTCEFFELCKELGKDWRHEQQLLQQALLTNGTQVHNK